MSKNSWRLLKWWRVARMYAQGLSLHLMLRENLPSGSHLTFRNTVILPDRGLTESQVHIQ